jgi:hypothetical protein
MVTAAFLHLPLPLFIIVTPLTCFIAHLLVLQAQQEAHRPAAARVPHVSDGPQSLHRL